MLTSEHHINICNMHVESCNMHVEFCNIMLNSATDVDMSFFSNMHVGSVPFPDGRKACRKSKKLVEAR